MYNLVSEYVKSFVIRLDLLFYFVPNLPNLLFNFVPNFYFVLNLNLLQREIS